MTNNEPRKLSVAVIGAGAAGLVTARECLREGHQVTVFEQNDTIGGIWNYQEECESDDMLGRNPHRQRVHSSMYNTLRTNLPRQIMSYSDFPLIPEVMGDKSHDPRRFPIHTEVCAWLGVFATYYDLWDHIHLSTQVTSLQPISRAENRTPDANETSAQEAAPRWRLKHKALHSKQAPPTGAALQHGTQQTGLNGTQQQGTKGIQKANQNGTYANGIADTDRLSPYVAHATAAANGARHDPAPSGNAHSPNAQEYDYDAAAASGFAQSIPSSRAPADCHSSSAPRPAAAPSNNQQPDFVTAPASDAQSHGHSVSKTNERDLSGNIQQAAPALVPSSGVTGQTSAAQTNGAHSLGVQEHEQIFDAVISCVGNYHEPNLPDVEGMDDFPGFQMHAHNYRTNAMFAGKRVIVVGSSFSGEEISRLVANVADHVYHSARSFLPNEVALRSNATRVAVLTGLDSSSTATLQDGAQLDNIHAVVYCTGYQYAYPFLEGTGLIKSQDMRVDPLWMHMFPPAVAPSLAFVGLIWKSHRNWQFELQAKLVARALSGRSKLPDRQQMEQEVADFYSLLRRNNVPVRYTHSQALNMPVDQFAYNAQLAKLCGPDARTHPPWVHEMYTKKAAANILLRPDTFRDVWDNQELETWDLLDGMCQDMLAQLNKADAKT